MLLVCVCVSVRFECIRIFAFCEGAVCVVVDKSVCVCAREREVGS